MADVPNMRSYSIPAVECQIVRTVSHQKASAALTLTLTRPDTQETAFLLVQILSLGSRNYFKFTYKLNVRLCK